MVERNMNEHVEVDAIKGFIPTIVVFFSITFGAVAHGLDRIRKHGWRGWLSFFTDIIVCSFVGWVFFNMLNITAPEYAVVGCSIGSYWGTRGFVFMRDWFIDSVSKLGQKND